MGDIKANRYFEVVDWEADSNDDPQPVTFKLLVSDIDVPEGVEGYDIGTILSDLIDAAGFNLSIEEVSEPNVLNVPNEQPKSTPSGVSNSITGTVTGTCIQAQDVRGINR